MLLVFFPPFTLELELKPQQSMVWKGLLEIICLEISLAVAGLRFDYSGHYQAEPQIFFFSSKKIPPLLWAIFSKVQLFSLNISTPIFIYTFPCSNLCPLPLICKNRSWREEYLCFLYMFIFVLGSGSYNSIFWAFSSYEKFSNSLIILVALHWTLSNFSLSHLKSCRHQNQTVIPGMTQCAE